MTKAYRLALIIREVNAIGEIRDWGQKEKLGEFLNRVKRFCSFLELEDRRMWDDYLKLKDSHWKVTKREKDLLAEAIKIAEYEEIGSVQEMHDERMHLNDIVIKAEFLANSGVAIANKILEV